MADDQGIEEMTQGGQGLVLGGAVAGELLNHLSKKPAPPLDKSGTHFD